MSKYLSTEFDIVDEVIQRVGKTIVLGAPLAAGKANHVINAFYQKAVSDPSISLTICTALTLEKPHGKSDLEKRFLGPFVDRVFGDYPNLDYEAPRKEGKLPPNIRVIEFYFPPGKFVGNNAAQQNYISTNYTHVVRDMLDRGLNVIAQIVAKKEAAHNLQYSLSCNPDVTLDLVHELKRHKRTFATVAQVNQNLPFMYGDAVVDEDYFDFILDDPTKYFQVFGPPKMRVSPADFMIGLYSSALVKDDGELQIGIGSLGDSTVYSLLLRHQENDVYRSILSDLNIPERFNEEINSLGGVTSFQSGLFGASEMLVDGFMHLYKAGIVKKKAYDHIGLQRLINRGLIKEVFDHTILEVLFLQGLISSPLQKEEFDFLKHWGILKHELIFSNDTLVTPSGESYPAHIDYANLSDDFKNQCLGNSLKRGQIMQG